MSLDTLKPKVGALIEKAKNASGGTAPSNAVYEIKEYNDNGYIKTLSYKIPSNLPQDTIPNHAMRADANSLFTKSIEEIITANNPMKVGQYAFLGLSGLKKVSCYDNIVSVDKGGFSSTSLNYNYLPPNIETIGQDAFAQCRTLVFTEIPASVKTIGLDAFYNNSNLTEIRFKGTPTSLNSRTFQSCNNIKNIYVPWAEGAVANAPWGATNATIHYNSEV
jgi:hypothetical protein